MMTKTTYKEGIYFGMSFTEYREIPYFSRSLAEEVLFDLEEAKYKLDNPEEPTDEMNLGTAIHSMFLEPEDFKKTYVKFPAFKDFPDKRILQTCDDIKEVLASVGEKKSGAKEDLIARVRPYLTEEMLIWEDVTKNFYAAVEEGGKQILSNESFEVIEGLRKSCENTENIKKIISGGYAEVTIIWKDEQSGVMCKCRIDYLRTMAAVDVKSFSVKNKRKSLFEYLFKETVYSYYNFQFAVYIEAIENIVKKIRAKKADVFGKVDANWLKEFLADSRKQFFIIYARTAAPYQMKAIELQKSMAFGATDNAYFSVPLGIWRDAIAKYAMALKTGIWREKEVEVMEDQHAPNVIYQASIY